MTCWPSAFISRLSTAQWNPLISARLERVVLTTLAVDPEDRVPGGGIVCVGASGAEQEGAAKLIVAPTQPPAGIATPAAALPHTSLPAEGTGRRLSVGGNMAAAFVAGFFWVPFTVVNQTDLSTIIFGCYFVCTILLLRMLWKGWDALPFSEARVTPGKAVGYLFIPLYSLYWCWVAIVGFAIDYNRHRKRAGGEPQAELSETAYKFFCLYHFYVPVVAIFIPLKEVSGWAVVLDMMVMTPMMIGSIARAIQRLPALEGRDLATSVVDTRRGVR